MSASQDEPASQGMDELLAIMRRLRDPRSGCPWDLQQSFASIAPYTIEEAYEVASAIEVEDHDGLKDELGDLLFQVVFHAQMANEQGLFGFADVARAICEKMIRRHPHVFARQPAGPDADAQSVKLAWEEIKRRERAAKPQTKHGLLDDVPRALPALTRAVKLQNRASEVGFDWPSAITVADKIAEEARELAEAVDSRASDRSNHVAEEFGDLLFAMANLSRHLKLDPEAALRAANAKFMRRFGAIEGALAAQNRSLEDATLEEMEALWQAAKRTEHSSP